MDEQAARGYQASAEYALPDIILLIQRNISFVSPIPLTFRQRLFRQFRQCWSSRSSKLSGSLPSYDMYARIQELCCLGHYQAAETVVDTWRSQMETTPFAVAFYRSAICHRRGDFLQARDLLSGHFEILNCYDSYLQRVSLRIIDLRMLQNVRASLEAICVVQDRLVQALKAQYSASTSLFGNCTPLEVYRLVLLARRMAQVYAEPDQPSVSCIALELDRVGRALLMVGADSLAYMTLSESAKLEPDPVRALRLSASIAAGRNNRRMELWLSMLVTEFVDGQRMGHGDEALVYQALEDECYRHGWEQGRIRIQIIKDRARYKDLLRSSELEAMYVGLMRDRGNRYQALGDFFGEWDVRLQLLRDSTLFVDPVNVHECKRYALRLLARWGNTGAATMFHLEFMGWFARRGCQASAYLHAKAAYELSPGSPWIVATVAAIISMVTTGTESRQWAERAYEASKGLDENHIVRQQAAVALAKVLPSEEAVRILRPFFKQYQANIDLVLDMFEILWQPALLDAKRGNAKVVNILLDIKTYILKDCKDEATRASLNLMRSHLLGSLQYIQGNHAEAFESWRRCTSTVDPMLPIPRLLHSTRILAASKLINDGEANKGLQELEAGLILARSTGPESSLFEYYILLGETYFKQALVLATQPPASGSKDPLSIIHDTVDIALRYYLDGEANLDVRRRDYNILKPADALTAKSELSASTSRLYAKVLPLVYHFQSVHQLWCWVQASKSRSFLETAAISEQHRYEAQGSDQLQSLDRHHLLRSYANPLINSGAASNQSSARARFRQVFEYLPLGAKVVEWFIIDDQIHLMICSRGEEPTVMHLGKHYPTELDRIQQLCRRDCWFTADGPVLLNTFEYLIEPLLAHTVRDEHLILVPTQELYRIPFHALQLSGEYLLERNEISYTLSLMTLVDYRMRMRHSNIIRPSDSKELIVAFPSGQQFDDDESATGKRILRDLCHERSASEALFEADATLENSLAQISDADLILLLSHASPNTDEADPLSFGIRLAGGGLLSARRVMELRLRAKTTILAGCESLHGQVSPANNYLGFINSFFLAGSLSVFGALYEVDVGDTVTITCKLVQKIRQSEGSMAKMVRSTLLEFMNEPGKRELKCWAAFALYGDGDVIF